MGIFNVSGNRFDGRPPKFAGAILDATGETERFLAMKQLFDIANKRYDDPACTIEASEFTYATKGAVCVLPNPADMYEQFDLDILFASNETIAGVPASTTKVMSLITGLPFIDNLMTKVTLVSGDIESGSGNYYSAGDILTIEDIMFNMLLPSSNTAAKTFAHHVGALILGNPSASVSDCVAAFVEEMNRRAGLIGCTESTFTTPSGLSTSNYSTANDLLRITIAASSFPEICRIWNKKTYITHVGGNNSRDQSITTTVTNETLESAYYIFGGKTGHITATPAPNALVMIAQPL